MFLLPDIVLSHAPPFIRLHFIEVFDQQSWLLTSVFACPRGRIACTNSYFDANCSRTQHFHWTSAVSFHWRPVLTHPVPPTMIHTVGDTSCHKRIACCRIHWCLQCVQVPGWLYHHMQLAMILCTPLHLTLASLCLSHFIGYITVRSAMFVLASSVCHVLSLTSNLLYGLSQSCIPFYWFCLHEIVVTHISWHCFNSFAVGK